MKPQAGVARYIDRKDEELKTALILFTQQQTLQPACSYSSAKLTQLADASLEKKRWYADYIRNPRTPITDDMFRTAQPGSRASSGDLLIDQK